MMNIKKTLTTLFSLLFVYTIYAQNIPPKRELRGVWIATVVNIDWPSEEGLSSQEQKREFIDLLDAHKKTGINAVFVQVRPAADAFYAKSREPWSKWLTGVQGKAPEPFYDPLAFMVEEAHKRGMELHAWFNPYRAVFNKYETVAPNHITNKKPEWFYTYGGKQLFNPGIPEVREYIVQVILDVVKNYDIDGVHFDDYFYPYPVAGKHIPDAATYRRYAKDGISLGDWRRENVNLLIKGLHDSIADVKSYVKFGVSPFGIWKNMKQDYHGSETNGGASYYHQYADSRRWMEQGWLDYIIPQIYFPIGHRLAAFDDLVFWWSENSYDRHFYIGMGAYRIDEWGDRDEMPNQIGFARKYDEVGGFVFFSSKSLRENPLGFTTKLRNDFFRYPALPPTMHWKDSIPPLEPQNLELKHSNAGNKLLWSAPDTASDGNTARGYVVYRFKQGEKLAINDVRNILTIQFNETTYTDKEAEKGNDYVYVVTAIDRLFNESTARCRISTQTAE